MGTNNGASLGAVGREDAHKFYPWDLTLVVGKKVHPDLQKLADAGFVTLLVDEKHVAFQKQRSAEGVRESLVESIDNEGQIQNIKIWRDGESKIVIAGRNRVKAIAMIAYRLCEKTGQSKESLGKTIKRVTAMVHTGDAQSVWRIMQAENNEREDLSLREKLEEVIRGRDLGVSDEDLARQLRVDVPTMKLKLRFFDLAPEVQEAVTSGEIAESTGYNDFVKWPRAQQVENLKQMREAGTLRGAEAKAAVAELKSGRKITKRAKEEAPARRAPNKVVVQKWVDALKDAGGNKHESAYAEGMRAGLMKALGMQPRGVPDGVKALLEAQ